MNFEIGYNFMTKIEKDVFLRLTLIIQKNFTSFTNKYALVYDGLQVNKVEKLIPNLDDKTIYISHHENLNLYLSLGLKLNKIH